MKFAKAPIPREERVCGGQARYALTAVIIVTGWTTTLLAQAPVNIPEESGGMLDWAVAAGLAALVCVAGFWNPKRTHQN